MVRATQIPLLLVCLEAALFDTGRSCFENSIAVHEDCKNRETAFGGNIVQRGRHRGSLCAAQCLGDKHTIIAAQLPCLL